MTEKEMYDCLFTVWDNMTSDKDRNALNEMLRLLDDMTAYLRYDLQCDYLPLHCEIKEGTFTF